MKIVLIGFMGSGKTSISKILAKNINFKWVDMDRVIIEKSGRNSDREIFDLDGEKVFRELEANTASRVRKREKYCNLNRRRNYHEPKKYGSS